MLDISKIKLILEDDNVIFHNNTVYIENRENASCKKSVADALQLKQEVDTNAEHFYKKTWK